MITMSIDEAVSKYGGETLREVIENVAHAGEYDRIWLYVHLPTDKENYTHFLCRVSPADDREVVRVLMSHDLSHEQSVYENGAVNTASIGAEKLDQPLVIRPKNVEKTSSISRQIPPIIPAWYLATSDSKHTRQVVVIFPPQAEVSPRVGNLIAASLMMANWGVSILFTPGTTSEAQGPHIFAKASGIVEMLKGQSASVAFAFYRLDRGCVFQLFVQIDTPSIRAKANKSPFLVETSHWLDDKESCRLVETLISRDEVEVCFVAPGNNGPCTGYFGLRVKLPQAVKEALRQEWNDLLAYHNGVLNRNYQAALDQYNRENPMESTPVLLPSKNEPRKVDTKPQKPQTQKKWWEFWK